MLTRLSTFLSVVAITVTLVYAQTGATQLTGTITAIEGDHIQIKDQAGKMVLVMLQKTTKYLKSQKPSTKAELKVGTRVLIDVKMDAKMKMYSADEIAIGVPEVTKPAPPKPGTTTVP